MVCLAVSSGPFGCWSFLLLVWKGLIGWLWRCIPSLAEAAVGRGTGQGLARRGIGRLNSVKRSERVNRVNISWNDWQRNEFVALL